MTKTKKRATLAETMSFAHLLPLNPGAAARADDDDDKDKDKDKGPDADNDDDGDGDGDKKPSGKKAKKARADDQGNDDGEDDGADGEGDDDGADDDDDKKKPAGKKAKKARADDDGDDDDDDDKEDGPSARAGAMRERRRCATIFGSRHAAGRPDLAAHLAFSTNMSAAEAIGTMKTLVGGEQAGARSTRSTLADRMQSEIVPNPGQGASAAPTGAKGLAAAMLTASKKAHGG